MFNLYNHFETVDWSFENDINDSVDNKFNTFFDIINAVENCFPQKTRLITKDANTFSTGSVVP